MKPQVRISENMWRGTILAITSFLLLLTVYCLSQGITVIFMHLYYIPIVLLCYHYRRAGFVLSALLSLTYLFLVIAFVQGNTEEITGACIRVAVFIGIAALVAYLSENLKTAHSELEKTVQIQKGIIQNANVWLTVLDEKGRVLVWNRAAERLSGYMAADVISRADVWKSLYPDADYRRKLFSAMMRVMVPVTFLR